jgi:murein DD-endopeptidase MepM/ murein hydrolase activator NlpD
MRKFNRSGSNKPRTRTTRGRAFTLAIIPNSGGFKREWSISYATIYFVWALLFSVGILIAVSILQEKPLEHEMRVSNDLTSAWLARWKILENGKAKITENLDELKDLGDGYFQAIFKSKPDLENFDETDARRQQSAKILPLMSVMRILTAREEAYISMPIGIPVHSNQITSLYGSRADPFGLETSFHTGIDFAGATGMPIYSTADGIVSGANDDGNTGLGKNVRVTHKFGLITAYAHMNAIAVRKDARVRRGDLLGFVGTTGRSTGPHLHYEVRIKSIEPENYFELTYNPMPFIREKL